MTTREQILAIVEQLKHDPEATDLLFSSFVSASKRLFCFFDNSILTISKKGGICMRVP